MSAITVRFVHRQSRTPVLELEVEASATIWALRELLMERLASEEACMMRVFVKWHAEIDFGGRQRKRLIELTDEDSEATLSSIGISHLSEVHLDGPLTGDCSEGVGQALAVLGAQIHRLDKGQALTNTLLQKLVAQNEKLVEAQQASRVSPLLEALIAQNALIHNLTSEAYHAHQAVSSEEELAYGQPMEGADDRYQRLLAELQTAERWNLSIEANRGPVALTIDRTTPHTTFAISDDGTTASKVSNGWATFRTSQPLTAANHKWAVRIVEDCGTGQGIYVGLLPKLCDAQVAQMECEEGFIGSTGLGGWGMYIDGSCRGDWECPPFRFAKGDAVVCDLNFAGKTLTLSCADKKVVGTIPSIKAGDELYPAVYLFFAGMKAEFIAQQSDNVDTVQ